MRVEGMYEAWMMVEQQLDSFGDKDWEVASVVGKIDTEAHKRPTLT